MSWSTSIYWLTRLDNISSFFSTVLGLSCLAIIAMLIFRGICYVDAQEYERKNWLLGIFIFLATLGGLGKVFTPTTKEAIFIVAGGKTLDYIGKDTSLQKIPGQITGITSTWLESKLKELEEDIEKESKNKK